MNSIVCLQVDSSQVAGSTTTDFSVGNIGNCIALYCIYPFL